MLRLAVLTVLAVSLSSASAFGQTLLLDSPALLHFAAIAQTAGEDKPGPVEFSIVVTPEAMVRPAPLVPLYAAQAVLHGLDFYTTFRALGEGHREGNPVIKGSSKTTMIGAKLAVTTLNVYLAEKIWKTRPKTAVLMVAALNGFLSAVVANNAKVLSSR